jgi:MFS family permease
MIVVASLRLSGFFAVANAWVIEHAKRPLILLGAIVATSGVFSAFLVNDAICLVLTPLVLELTLALGRRPAPYLLAVAMASNVGSTATIVTQQHWSQSEVGLVTTVGGLIGLAVQTPIGGAIDETRAKRGVIVLALAVLGVGAVIIFAWPTFWPVAIANSLMAVVGGDVFGPAVAALTLGLNVRKQLAGRMGRNSAFDHAGNVAIAVAAGAVGYAFSQRAVFLLVPFFAVLASLAVLSIPADAIDYDRARDLERNPGVENGAGAAGYGVLFKSRPLVIFGLCAMLFHFANAPLLPLVGQKLAAAHPKEATAMMSACIVAAQMVMLPIALLVGRKADVWGRKPLFLAGFAILPIRAVLYTFSDTVSG